jgi:hypothetical protein
VVIHFVYANFDLGFDLDRPCIGIFSGAELKFHITMMLMKLPGSEPDFVLSKITRPQWLEQILTVPSSSSQRSSTVRFSKGEVILHCFSYNELDSSQRLQLLNTSLVSSNVR